MKDFVDMIQNQYCLFLDSETTGLSDGDVIVQLAIIDCDGKKLFDSYINAGVAIPASATKIHGITDAHIADAPSISDVSQTIYGILAGRNVVIYNADFDLRLLKQTYDYANLPYPNFRYVPWCAMMAYAEHYGEPGYYGGYRWQKLTSAMAQCGLPVADAHTALGDATMTFTLVSELWGRK